MIWSFIKRTLLRLGLVVRVADAKEAEEIERHCAKRMVELEDKVLALRGRFRSAEQRAARAERCLCAIDAMLVSDKPEAMKLRVVSVLLDVAAGRREEALA